MAAPVVGFGAGAIATRAATSARPGAGDALAAVHRQHGRAVVTATDPAAARRRLAQLGLDVDEVVGQTSRGRGSDPLQERGVVVHVGDRVLDIEVAVAAGASGVGVATAPRIRADLLAAGATAVLDSLAELPRWLDARLLELRLADLERRLCAQGSVLVAFSGGADSAMLLAAAVGALGAGHVVAATAYSPSLPVAEREAAAAFARGLDVRHVTPATHELDRAGYRANAGDRCGFCKSELLDTLVPLAADLGLAAVATGTNADDAVAGFRPGIAAAAVRGACTPLRDAGLTKPQVREAARRWGLVTWDKPAAACLSSRIAYGVQVSRERLARVESAENGIRAALGDAGIAVRDLRVRDLGDRARVEVDHVAVAAVSASLQVRAAARAAGFAAVEVDPRGFRSGSMNELLPEPGRWR